MDPSNLGYLVDLLTAFERTPLGIQPNVTASVQRPGLASQKLDPQVAIAEKKIYALAMRAFAAENTVVQHWRGPPPLPPVIQHNITGAVDSTASTAILVPKIDTIQTGLQEVKASIQELQTLFRTNSTTSGVRNASLANGVAQIIGKLDTLRDQSSEPTRRSSNAQPPGYSSPLTDTSGMSRELEQVRRDLQNISKEVKQHVQRFENVSENLLKMMNTQGAGDKPDTSSSPNWEADDSESKPDPAETTTGADSGWGDPPPAEEETKDQPAENQQNNEALEELASIKAQIANVTATILATTHGDLPKTTDYDSGDSTEILELKGVLDALLGAINGISKETTRLAQDYKAGRPNSLISPELPLAGTWSQLRADLNFIAALNLNARKEGDAADGATGGRNNDDVIETVQWMTQVDSISATVFGISSSDVIPKPCDVDSSDFPAIVTLKGYVNTLIDNIRSFSDHISATEESSDGSLGRSPSGEAELPGIWGELQGGIQRLTSSYRLQLISVDNIADQYLIGNFNASSESKLYVRPSLHALGDKLGSVKEQQLQYCSEIAEGRLSARILDDGQADGAWMEIRNGMNHMHKKLPSYISQITQAISDAAKGEFERARISETVKSQSTGSINKLATWADSLITNLQAFAKDVDGLSKGMVEGKVRVLSPEKYIGDWRQTRVELNKMTRVVAGKPGVSIVRYSPRPTPPANGASAFGPLVT